MSKKKYSLIVAFDKNQGIGVSENNDLPAWALEQDLPRFSRLTSGNAIFMYKTTFESMGSKPLRNRDNVVILRKGSNFEVPEGVTVFYSLEEGLEAFSNSDKKLYLIGGSYAYKDALDRNLVDSLNISHVRGEFNCDVFFPKVDFNDWENVYFETFKGGKEIKTFSIPKTSDEYTFKVWIKKEALL